MDKENEKIKNQQEEKGTANPTNHLPLIDNSMEMKPQVSSDSSVSKVDEGSDTSSKAIVCVNRNDPSPPEDAVGGTIDFTSIGPTEVHKLEIDRPNFGTDYIIMKRQMSETTFLYDWVKERYNSFEVSEMYGLNYQPGELRGILTLADSLAPVCTKRCNMF
ncbi:hypothetical protein MKW98_000132 [Papaver atlanticum]|uniref:Uncharacterized protein n=1 Tax=Papaver atlanticum TaxID=357466 RepID=A0AAD4XJC8_9MAGN|nr:hypothetical protein MKW98_000132 [Papaver atlanticum]